MKIKFSQNLRALREAEKMKQSDLARVLGITQRKLSYLETGKVEPNLEDLWKIADYLGLTVDELIGRTDI